MPKIALILPCFNESDRLDRSQLEQLREIDGLNLFLVDDGSTDDTLRILTAFSEKSNADKASTVVALPQNVGKGEAVRQGMLRAWSTDAEWIGYLDADFATSAEEVRRILGGGLSEGCDVLLGARVRMLGKNIVRRTTRHYLGRIFATFASLTLRLPIYDTQCGFKVFRRTEVLRTALKDPFLSRWSFDVELLARLLVANSEGLLLPVNRVIEVPLNHWEDKAGSRLKFSGMVRAFWDLARLNALLFQMRRTPIRRGAVKNT